MTSILAIETSTPACSVALVVGDAKFFRYSEEPRSHTRLIMGMIDDVLREAGITIDGLDAVAVTVGPGSFTGLRIGFSTAQGLAFGADIPVIPVSTLEVMAQTYKRKHSTDMDCLPIVMPVLDARMGEFNCGAYKLDSSGQFVAVVEDQLLSKNNALELCESLQPGIIVGDHSSLFNSPLPERSDIDSYSVQALYPDAADLVDIALTRYAQGSAVPVAQVDLVYLRGTDAWKKHTPLRTIKN
jgi:tRNA threonylcarbamoyladenosine biosynthesis protein TsaB